MGSASVKAERPTNGAGYFANRDCPYFPCHARADPAAFNCLFCYCPLYLLGDKCGGNFRFLPNGRKDCSGCLYPHLRENYASLTARYAEIERAMPESGD